MPGAILALDQGTTSSRAILFDLQGRPLAAARRPLACQYPAPGWVEQDPAEILRGQLEAAREALETAGLAAADLAAVGIANQRETTLVWERATGRPLTPAIVWQCRRTAALCDELRASLGDETIRERTGLVIDPYFSATKLKWILDGVPDARARAEGGELLFGTVDTWLIWNLTGGRVHVTDCSNASRTMLLNLSTLRWDEEILGALGIPPAMLPEVRPSSGLLGTMDAAVLGAPVPITAAIGDQQAALFGQGCFREGMAKSTYGTGCFLLMNTGRRPVPSRHGLLATVAWSVEGVVEYALEGSVFVAGAAVQWLRDQLGLLTSAEESEALARSVADTGGVYFVPAFVGLGAPHWDERARGTIIGLTRGTEKAHLVRAALEATAFQTADVLRAMEADLGAPLTELRVDGGAAANGFLLQFQADLLGVPVLRPRVVETTALGAAYLARLAIEPRIAREELASHWQLDRRFEPSMTESRREQLLAGWRRAVDRSREWAG
jgi:glycerol kinase